MSPKSKALTNAQRALKRHELMAKEEHKKREPYIKKFGTFEERMEQFAKFKKNL
jgi:hypothetical protein